MHIGETDHMQYDEVHKTNIQGSEVIIHFIRLFPILSSVFINKSIIIVGVRLRQVKHDILPQNVGHSNNHFILPGFV